jgi:hypothetical protein
MKDLTLISTSTYEKLIAIFMSYKRIFPEYTTVQFKFKEIKKEIKEKEIYMQFSLNYLKFIFEPHWISYPALLYKFFLSSICTTLIGIMFSQNISLNYD